MVLQLNKFKFFIIKQLKLILNLFYNNFDTIPQDNWKHLYHVVQAQEKIARNNIMNENDSQKKIATSLPKTIAVKSS